MIRTCIAIATLLTLAAPRAAQHEVQELVAKLTEPTERHSAARALLALNRLDTLTIERLAPTLTTADPETAALTWCLLAAGPKLAVGIGLEQPDRLVTKAQQHRDYPAVQTALIRLLGDVHLGRYAREALVILEQPARSAAPAILQLLQRSAGARRQACYTLPRLNVTGAAFFAALQAAGIQNSDLARSSLRAMAHRDDFAFDLLRAQLATETDAKRWSRLDRTLPHALQHPRAKQLITPLIERVRAPGPLRVQVLRSIIDRAPAAPRSRSLFLACIPDPSTQIAVLGLAGVRAAARRGATGAAVRAAVVRALTDTRVTLQENAVWTVVAIPSLRANPPVELFDLLKHKNADLRNAAEIAVTACGPTNLDRLVKTPALWSRILDPIASEEYLARQFDEAPLHRAMLLPFVTRGARGRQRLIAALTAKDHELRDVACQLVAARGPRGLEFLQAIGSRLNPDLMSPLEADQLQILLEGVGPDAVVELLLNMPPILGNRTALLTLRRMGAEARWLTPFLHQRVPLARIGDWLRPLVTTIQTLQDLPALEQPKPSSPRAPLLALHIRLLTVAPTGRPSWMDRCAALDSGTTTLIELALRRGLGDGDPHVHEWLQRLRVLATGKQPFAAQAMRRLRNELQRLGSRFEERKPNQPALDGQSYARGVLLASLKPKYPKLRYLLPSAATLGLGDPSPGIRLRALDYGRELDRSDFVAAVKQLRDDPDADVQRRAHRWIRDYERRRPRPTPRGKGSRERKSIPATASDAALCGWLYRGSAKTRITAAARILHRRRIIPQLLGGLRAMWRHHDPTVRKMGYITLLQLASVLDPEKHAGFAIAYQSEVAKLLTHEDFTLRRLAVRACGELTHNGAKLLPALTDSVFDPNPTVRLEAIRALARLGPRAAPAAQLLHGIRDDKDSQIRSAVRTALQAIPH